MEKSLLLVTEAFELGGVETYIRCEIEQLVRQGWRVHFACGRRFSSAMLPSGLASATTGLPLGPEASISDFLDAVDQLVDLVRREGVSVIHAHPFTSLVPAMAASSVLGIPCVATLHGPSSVSGSYGAAYDFMMASLVLPSASHVSAVSGEVAALAEPYVVSGRLSVLPNAVPAVIASTSQERGDRWLAVSRLDPAKAEGVIHFARSAAEIGLPGVDICGDGVAITRVKEALADLIESGFVRLLGPSADASSLMQAYAGVAGMGRVALEGVAAGLPVVLVGYDGVKGLLGPELYADAVHSNLSGRGLGTVSSAELGAQLQRRDAQDTAAFSRQLLVDHDAVALWERFARSLPELLPARSVILEAYVVQLRAMYPDSDASAYWSREVMDAMSRVVASPLVTGTPIVPAFTIFSQAFTRSIVEQQGIATRHSVEQISAPAIEIARSDALLTEMQDWMARLDARLGSLAEAGGAADSSLRLALGREMQRALDLLRPDVAGLADELHEMENRVSAGYRQTLELEVQRALDVLRPDMREMNNQLHDVAARMAADHRHESTRIREAMHVGAGRLMDGLREHIVAEIEAIHRHQGQVSNDLRAELRAEFETLRQAARHESQIHTELVGREMSAIRDTIRQQTIASTGEFRRESRLAFNEAIRGIEVNMEQAIKGMETSIRQDLANVAAGMDLHAAMNRDIAELHQRVLDLEQELVEVYGSSSWVLTRPIRVLKRLILEPRATWHLIRQAIVSDSTGDGTAGVPARRSGRLSRAWNFIRRSARTGRIDPADKARLIGMIRSNYNTVLTTLKIEVPRPALAEPVLEDVFVWAVIDWHFRMQRPQHLAAAMAGKGHRVFYISNNFADSAEPGFTVEALDTEGRLFQVNLNLAGSPQIYFDVATGEQVQALQASMGELLRWTGSTRSISLVQHPFWLQPAQSLPNMRLVYDCMDHHGGFEDNAESVLAGERALVESADLLIVTSQWLYEEMQDKSSNIAMIRNATEYEHFCERPEQVFVDAAGRRIIGYYGAIAEWFDVELVRRVAEDHPQDLILLVGRDTAGAAERLTGVANVQFVGEVPYKELPYWLHAFDVCLLPFRVIPLTLATNPVKVYEYLSAGKPTVSVDLPEMSQFEGLVRLATAPAQFSEQVSLALQPADMHADAVHARQRFARQQTWAHRAVDLDAALVQIEEPRVSVIVLCYNNLEFTQACLHSLDLYSDYPNLEIIAVDNASSDGTPEFLADWAAGAENRIFIRNDSNLGFSAGNNVGLSAATGEYLVVLNNDTYVTPGWVRGMVRHLKRNPEAGLIGPVTNNIGNEARIEIHYATMDEMIERASEHTRRHPGMAFELTTAAFFCVMMTRKAYERVGPMDENFGVGFFEDDDYCRRLSLEGFSILCADDVFVHHHLSASFNKLKSDAKQVLFEKNKAIYEAKWGPWVPHVYRERDRH